MTKKTKRAPTGKPGAASELRARWTYCIRQPNAERAREATYENYKKGWEVRISVMSAAERKDVERRLTKLGLKPGKPYRKSAKMWIVPVYGKDAVELFTG